MNPTKRVSIGNIGNGAFDGSVPCINIGDSDSGFIGSADGVLDIYCNNAKVGYIDSSGIHLNDQGLHIGDARMGSDGNVWGTRWNASGQWLWDAIVEQLNTRATIDYVNQTFARKNTASLQDWGWVRDESTGFIMQWGTLGSSNGTYNFPRAFPVGCLAIFVTNTNQQGGAVDNAFGYPVSNSQFFAATKASTDGNIVNGYPIAWLALGR
ncbi:TPA: phage tail protein [Salmonella enterica]|nr:phage tail protein [Salmonella enterica]